MLIQHYYSGSLFRAGGNLFPLIPRQEKKKKRVVFLFNQVSFSKKKKKEEKRKERKIKEHLKISITFIDMLTL